jgi:hypothetical protein
MRFSLRTLLVLFMAMAFACAFAVTINPIWAQLVFLMTLATVILAAISSRIGPPNSRVFCGSFAFASGVYLCLLIVADRTDYFLEQGLVSLLLEYVTQNTSYHDYWLSHARRDPGWQYNFTKGFMILGHSGFAIVFGLVIGFLGTRLGHDASWNGPSA